LQSLSDMDIRDLMYLEASAAAGNFTRAAKSLRIDTSTISRRVGRFEDELGLALFERGHDGVRLTSGGKAVLPHIRRALAELDAIRHAGDQNGTGTVGEVRLAVRMPPIGEPLRSLLLGWREKYPEVVLTVAEMNEWEIQTAIQERRIDVALMTSHTLWPDAVTAPLFRERVVAAIPREHPLANDEALDWESLRKETLPGSGLGQQSVRARVLCIVHGQWRQVLRPRREQAVRVRIGRSRIRNHPRHEEPVGGRVPGRRVSADPGGERLGAR
jgi:DNA-binding transcriptional LysR family regulator